MPANPNKAYISEQLYMSVESVGTIHLTFCVQFRGYHPLKQSIDANERFRLQLDSDTSVIIVTAFQLSILFSNHKGTNK